MCLQTKVRDTSLNNHFKNFTFLFLFIFIDYTCPKVHGPGVVDIHGKKWQYSAESEAQQDLVFLVLPGYSEGLLMSQRKVLKGKGEEEEGTDGAGKQGGEGKDDQPHQKKKGLAGVLHYTKKRKIGQPRSSSSVAKEQDKKHFPTPATPSPPTARPTVKQQGGAQPQLGSPWESWQKSPDPQQPIVSASVAVQPSVEQQPDDDETVLATEGSTPPVVVKYQHDNITVSMT